MANSRERRLLKELKDLTTAPCNISATLSNNHLHEWTAQIHGPQDTPYENGIFSLEISFPEAYPLNPPEVKFLTKIWHPNINSEGNINLETFGRGWCPALTAEKFLLTVSSFLDDPFPDREEPCFEEAIVPRAAEMWLEDKGAFDEKARRWTKRYASGLGGVSAVEKAGDDT